MEETIVYPELIYFVNKVCSPEWTITNNFVDKYCLVFVTKGTADYWVDGYSFQAQEGDVIFVKPGSERYATTTGMNCVAIDFLLPEGQEIDLPVTFSLGNFEDFHRVFQDLKYEWLQRNSGFRLKSNACLMLILHKLIYERNKSNKNSHVELIKRFIMKHYRKNLTVKMVADEVGLSSVYCGVLFKKVENCTISEYVSRIRINKAISLLETGEYNISEVAEETGFIDVYYFSNTFKKMVGMSPSTYKNTRNVSVST